MSDLAGLRRGVSGWVGRDAARSLKKSLEDRGNNKGGHKVSFA